SGPAMAPWAAQNHLMKLSWDITRGRGRSGCGPSCGSWLNACCHTAGAVMAGRPVPGVPGDRPGPGAWRAGAGWRPHGPGEVVGRACGGGVAQGFGEVLVDDVQDVLGGGSAAALPDLAA